MQDYQRQRIDTKKLPRQVVEKWSYSILAEGFVPFPKKLLRCIHKLFRDPDSIEELAVLLAVVDFKRPAASRRPSLGYLAFLSGLEEDRFSAALQRLQAKGYAGVTGDSSGLNVSLEGLLDAVEKETA